MRALQLGETTPLPATMSDDAAKPRPGKGELLIAVQAAGVTPSELQWYPTTHTKTNEPRRRAIPGHEFSGTVAAVGGDVTGFQIGQAIYGMNDWFADGATAEFCITQPHCIAAKPVKLSHVEAASVPIGALTAWQGLLDRAKVQAGERVLIHGGAGAVGVFAVQLARIHKAHVITTAAAANAAFLKELGADEVLDFNATKFEQDLKDIDIVFDTVGGDTLRRSWDLLKPDGRMVTIASNPEGNADERTRAAFFVVEPNQKQLTEIAALLDAGTLQAVVDAVVSLERAEKAYARQITDRHGRGKVVIAITADAARSGAAL